jgi:hypothetical protein
LDLQETHTKQAVYCHCAAKSVYEKWMESGCGVDEEWMLGGYFVMDAEWMRRG